MYDDPKLFDRVNLCLMPFTNIILILPSDNSDESIEILNNQGRSGEDWIPVLIEHFVRHPSNAKIAKFTIFTKGKTPEMSRDEILNLIEFKVRIKLREEKFRASCYGAVVNKLRV